jgi:hypothetical protein
VRASERAERSDRGFIAIEWVAALVLLLFPVVVLVATLPGWAERRNAATIAAREAARVLVRDWPDADARGAELAAAVVATDHGVPAADVRTRVRAGTADRGGEVRVDVEVTMPAVAVPGISVGRWRYTAHATRRIDDYRSR